MFPKEKLNVIANYLKAEFPGCDLDDRYEFERIAQTFRLDDGKKTYLVTVSRAFIDDHTPSKISKILESFQVRKYFNGDKISRVIITNKGIKTEAK